MAKHPFEYKMLVEYISPEAHGQYPHFTRPDDQEGLCATLDEVFSHLPDSVPEGYEVVSHDITISRNTMIVTVLLRRPTRARTARRAPASPT